VTVGTFSVERFANSNGEHLLGAREMARQGDELRTCSDAAWDVAIVHGPGREKIDNRIEILHSFEAAGGRRA
jgi:hypothetical protein